MTKNRCIVQAIPEQRMVPGEKAAHPGDEQVLLVPEAAHPEDLLGGAPPDTEPREPEALRQGEAAIMADQAMDGGTERESGGRKMILKSLPLAVCF